mgnify:CR=1 FL=1
MCVARMAFISGEKVLMELKNQISVGEVVRVDETTGQVCVKWDDWPDNTWVPWEDIRRPADVSRRRRRRPGVDRFEFQPSHRRDKVTVGSESCCVCVSVCVCV